MLLGIGLDLGRISEGQMTTIKTKLEAAVFIAIYLTEKKCQKSVLPILINEYFWSLLKIDDRVHA